MEKPKLLTREQVKRELRYAAHDTWRYTAAATSEALAADLRLALSFLRCDDLAARKRTEDEIRNRWKSTGFLGEQP